MLARGEPDLIVLEKDMWRSRCAVGDRRGTRYCEILLATFSGATVQVDVYNTEGLVVQDDLGNTYLRTQ